jgi:hypothetical protein
MRVIRVFPRRTSFTPDDSMAFVGDPPLWRPPADAVHVSVTFTWDVDEAIRLCDAWRAHYHKVKIGGPAWEYERTPNLDNFVPGMYVRPGITFTTRGCDNNCPWCMVPEREGKFRIIGDFAPGWIVQDNNILMAPQEHFESVIGMLKTQRKAATFSGGLDACLLTDWHADALRGLRIDQLFFAADTNGAIGPLEKALRRLQIPRRKARCYVLCAFNGETIDVATERLRAVWNAGAMPFAQLYQPPGKRIDYSQEWRDLARTWSRPAAMMTLMGEDDR